MDNFDIEKYIFYVYTKLLLLVLHISIVVFNEKSK